MPGRHAALLLQYREDKTMTYQFAHNGSGWYYDVLNERGEEVDCRGHFPTLDAAKLSAEIHRHINQLHQGD